MLIRIKLQRLAVALTMASLLCIGCNSGLKVDKTMSGLDDTLMQTVYNSVSVFTDSAKIQLKLLSPLVENYSDNNKTQKFPRGIQAVFYDKEGAVNVDLFADSAINIQKEKMMRFYKNVIVYDYRKGDTLYTDALYWDQNSRKIFSDQKVRQAGANITLEGDGFDADEMMTDVVLRNPRGIIY